MRKEISKEHKKLLDNNKEYLDKAHEIIADIKKMNGLRMYFEIDLINQFHLFENLSEINKEYILDHTINESIDNCIKQIFNYYTKDEDIIKLREKFPNILNYLREIFRNKKKGYYSERIKYKIIEIEKSPEKFENENNNDLMDNRIKKLKYYLEHPVKKGERGLTETDVTNYYILFGEKVLLTDLAKKLTTKEDNVRTIKLRLKQKIQQLLK